MISYNNSFCFQYSPFPEIEYKMLRKSLLFMINGSLYKRNKYIVNVTCYSKLSRSTHMNFEDSKNIYLKKLNSQTEKVKLKIADEKSKATKKNERQEIIQHLSKNLSSEIISTCLSVLMKTGRDDKNLLYLIDNGVAAEFVSLIIDDLSRDTCYIAELNPGVGMLTTELLKAGIPLIHLYEEKKEFDPMLNNLSNIYPGKLDLRKYNLLKINTLLYLDKVANRDEMQKIFQGVETKRWEDTCMQVIGATSTMRFIKHVIYSLLFRKSFMTYGRTVFYMAIPPVIWHVGIYFIFCSCFFLSITLKHTSFSQLEISIII